MSLITKTVQVDGPRQAVVLITVEADSASEMNLEKILDAKDDIYPLGVKTDTTINQIWWGNSYFDAFLYTDEPAPQLLWVLAVGSDAHIDFRSFGGLKIPKSLDGSGNLLMSTAGFATVGSKGSMVIELKKD